MRKQERIEAIEARLTRYLGTMNNLQKSIDGASAELAELKKGMTLAEIKQAIADGETVCWATDNYEVIKDCIGQYLIWSKFNDHYIGLTHMDNITMNGKEEDFYIKRD